MKFFILNIFFITTLTFADTILLKNGNYLRGKATLKEDSVKIESYDGVVKEIPKSEILKIDLRNMTPKEIEEVRIQEEKLVKLRIEKAKKANEEIEKRIKDIENKIKQANAEENKKLLQELKELKSKITAIEEENTVTELGPFYRSAILPGYGNIFVGNARKRKLTRNIGIFYSILTTSLLANSIYRYIELTEKENRYESTLTEVTALNIFITTTQPPNQINFLPIYSGSRNAYDNYKDANEIYNLSIYALGATYLFQLAHAYYLGYSSVREYTMERDNAKFNLHLAAYPEKKEFSPLLERGNRIDFSLVYKYE